MVELIPGSRVYAYQAQIDGALKRTSATSRARYLLLCMYTPSELVEAGNLTGKNNKKGLDQEVVSAITGKINTLNIDN